MSQIALKPFAKVDIDRERKNNDRTPSSQRSNKILSGRRKEEKKKHTMLEKSLVENSVRPKLSDLSCCGQSHLVIVLLLPNSQMTLRL